jgi:hypothetical protein
MDPDAASLKDIKRRTLRYLMADGLYQLTGGALFTFLGAQGLIVLMVPEGSLRLIYFIVGQCVLMLVALAALRVVQRLKARITYPRAGYAGIDPPSKARITAALLVGLFWSAAIPWQLVLLLRKPSYAQLMPLAPLMVGVFWAVVTVAAWVRERDPHWLGVAAVALASGLWAYHLKAVPSGMFWVLMSMGVASLVLGTVRLRRFLREKPKPAETET